VVPFALLATMFESMWDPFFTLLVLLAVTFGSRAAGLFIAASGEQSVEAPPAATARVETYD
jgi:hypothetical protein